MLEGVFPVVPTPFSEDGGAVLYDRFAEVVEMCIREGASAIVLFGAGGEFYKLDAREKETLLQTALEVCGKQTPVIATVTQHATQHAVREAAHFAACGVAAVNLMPPSFGAPTPAMVREHILAVAAAVQMPLIIQYAPALTGGVLPAALFAEVAERAGGELYIKVEATPTGPAISAIEAATGGRYRMIIGNGGECLYEALCRGGAGVMPGAALVKPYCDIIRAFRGGEQEDAYRLYCDFLPYLHFIHRHIEEFVAMEKMILQRRGILQNHVCRKPDMVPDEVSAKLLMRHVDAVCRAFYPD